MTKDLAVYLVPTSYDGPCSEHFTIWGGDVPHITLALYDVDQPPNVDEILETVSGCQSNGEWRLLEEKISEKWRWTKKIWCMQFLVEDRIEEILKQLHKHGFRNVAESDYVHFTLKRANEDLDEESVWKSILRSPSFDLAVAVKNPDTQKVSWSSKRHRIHNL